VNYYGKMDEECIKLCDAINKISDLYTIESCCGHGKEPFRIWISIDDLEDLPTLLYYCDPCHVGFRWNCFVTTDCGMNPVHFRLESESKGEQSYEEADIIAEEIEKYLLEEALEEDEEL
jgi:hypothetical protein